MNAPNEWARERSRRRAVQTRKVQRPRDEQPEPERIERQATDGPAFRAMLIRRGIITPRRVTPADWLSQFRCRYPLIPLDERGQREALRGMWWSCIGTRDLSELIEHGPPWLRERAREELARRASSPSAPKTERAVEKPPPRKWR